MPTVKEIKIIAKDRGVVFPKKIKKSEMVHILQIQEGNNPCYAKQHCCNEKCLWIKDCQKEYKKINL